MAERRAVANQMAKRYERAPKKEKGRMLDELCALTGWTRRHARRALGQVVHGSAERPKRTRDRVYSTHVAGPLTRIWVALDGPAGKRLTPFRAE